MKRSVGWYEVNGRQRRIIFGSKLARFLGRGHINFAVTLSKDTIRVKEHWITRKHLAHEDDHCLEAEARGWFYLPWVLWGYVSTLSHDRAEAERRADAHMAASWRKYPDLGNIPSYVKRDV